MEFLGIPSLDSFALVGISRNLEPELFKLGIPRNFLEFLEIPRYKQHLMQTTLDASQGQFHGYCLLLVV